MLIFCLAIILLFIGTLFIVRGAVISGSNETLSPLTGDNKISRLMTLAPSRIIALLERRLPEINTQELLASSDEEILAKCKKGNIDVPPDASKRFDHMRGITISFDEDFPYKENYYDYVQLNYTLNQTNDVERYTQKAKNSLVYGGFLVIVDYELRDDVDCTLLDIEATLSGMKCNYRSVGKYDEILGKILGEDFVPNDILLCPESPIKSFVRAYRYVPSNYRKDIYWIFVAVDDAREDKKLPYTDLFGQESELYTKGKFYIDWTTDRQINQIMKYADNFERGRLIDLLGRRFYHMNPTALTKMLSTERDSEIYRKIKLDRNECARGEYHARSLFENIRELCMNKCLVAGKTYLDIGCGDALITKEFGKLIGATQIDCVEIKSVSLEGVNIFDNMKDLESDKYDVITALMSFHHIRDLDGVVEQLYRVLKPTGYLIIKEHDCWTAFDAMLVDVEHCVFISALEGKDTTKEKDIVIHYKNYYGWDVVFDKLRWYAAERIRHGPWEKIGPSRAFIAVYKKKP